MTSGESEARDYVLSWVNSGSSAGIQTVGMGMPETRYARSGDVAVAYQVLGEGLRTPDTV